MLVGLGVVACGVDPARLPPKLEEIDSGFGNFDAVGESGGLPSEDTGTELPGPDQEGGFDDASEGGETSGMPGEEGGSMGTPMEPGEEAECQGGAGPAVVTRLSRGEYGRTVRAVLDDPSIDEGSFIPASDIEGFVGAPTLVTSSSELEDYLAAAERLARVAMTSPWLDGVDLEDRAQIARFARDFGQRMYRRPLTDAEVERLLDVYDDGVDAENGAAGAEWLLQGLFSSPNFLYRIEVGDEARAVDGLVPLTGYERASRVSYLFRGEAPDALLMEAAAAGELDDPAQVRAHAQRLATSGQAIRLLEFFNEWTGVTASDAALWARLQRIDPSNPDIAQIAAQSMQAFVQHVVFENEGSFGDLLTTAGIAVNADLAAALGMPGRFEGEMTFLPTEERPGILAQPGTLAVRSSDTFAGATIRGHFILDHVFCQAVPLPDGNEFSQFPNIEEPLSTDRATLEVLHADAAPACRGCHAYIDPYGFAFENYDRQGRYRTHQELIPGRVAEVDASGVVTTREGTFPYENLTGFASIVSGSETVHACLSKQLLRFALRRPIATSDGCSAQHLTNFALSGQSVVETFVEATTTESFLFLQSSSAEI